MNVGLAVGLGFAVVAGLGIGWVVSTPRPAASVPAQVVPGIPATPAAPGAPSPMAFIGYLLGAGPSGPDPDTIPDKTNTIRIAGTDVVFARPVGGKLSPPRYLPAWAPVYPGAKLTMKLANMRDGHVFGRGTEYFTDEDFDKVVAFYDDYYRDHGVIPPKVFVAQYGKIYSFDSRNGYQSMINLQSTDTGGPRRVAKIIIAQTASE